MGTVQLIDENSPYFRDVLKLWRKSSDTLGNMPEGGFVSYAQNNGMAVLTNEAGNCWGYTIFRKVRDRITIAHFCIAEEARGLNLSRKLHAWLVDHSKNTRGIILSCRSDFSVSNLWPKLGYVPIGKKRGRAGELTIWSLSHNLPTLFSDLDEREGLKVIFDANIYIDLLNESNSETQQLKADWAAPYLTLYYTGELIIDLDRNQDREEARKSIATLKRNYDCLECTPQEFVAAEKLLVQLAPTTGNQQDESDYRHLIRACACGAEIFVTRDGKLLDAHDAIYKLTGLTVVRPAELTTHIDSIINQHLYCREQVSGATDIIDVRMESIDPEIIEPILRPGEGRNSLGRVLESYLAKPTEYECHLISDLEGVILACYVLDKCANYLRIPVFRVSKHRRAFSLSRALLTKFTRLAVKDGKNGVLVTDNSCEKKAFHNQGYFDVAEGHLKLILRGWVTAAEAISMINWPGPEAASIRALVNECIINPEAATKVEHMLWPVKIADAALRNYIVAIEPGFAEQLFDHRLASEGLFGVDTDLALSMDSVYYRSARTSIPKNARIIWYVTKNPDYPNTMTFRACSRVVNVDVGVPKALFKKYERLGVFQFDDVLQTAGALDNVLMAFQFDDTELLKPITAKDFRPILEKHGVKSQFQSPTEITPQLFGELYAALFDSSKIC